LLYYFDESGDKGFVDKASLISEYGIVAGILISEHAQEMLSGMIEEAVSQKIDAPFKKLHCSEIFKNDENPNLRDTLYSVLTEFREYQIIYEGQYSIGVKKFEESISKMKDHYKKNLPDNIKIQASKERTRLYISLLRGIIFKLEEFAIFKGEKDVCMISDRIDQGVAKEVYELLDELRSDTDEIVARSFNIQTRIKTERTFKIISKGDLSVVRKVKSIEYSEEVTPILFAADFICFELLRHFRKKIKTQQAIKFHSEESLKGFKLKNRVAFLGDNSFSDLVFDPSFQD
jgi:hypothetical protein